MPCSCHDVLPLTQASQNLVVLAREDAGAEKIFRSNGVQLLQRLLDTGEPDLMLAALRTLVGICSEHQSRVGVAEGLATVSDSLSGTGGGSTWKAFASREEEPLSHVTLLGGNPLSLSTSMDLSSPHPSSCLPSSAPPPPSHSTSGPGAPVLSLGSRQAAPSHPWHKVGSFINIC